MGGGIGESEEGARKVTKMRKGLTLMELLTVISILATLAALLFPVYLNLRTRTDITVCADQLRQIGIALKMYAHDYGDDTPYGMPSYLGALYPNYISNKEIFVCPTFRKIAGNELIKLHAFFSQGLGYQSVWTSYWMWMIRGLDHLYHKGLIDINFSEVYAKRGDKIPILMCETHFKGCPRTNIEYVLFAFPELRSKCYNFANPSAPVLILRWNGSVNAVYGQLSDTNAMLLSY